MCRRLMKRVFWGINIIIQVFVGSPLWGASTRVLARAEFWAQQNRMELLEYQRYELVLVELVNNK